MCYIVGVAVQWLLVSWLLVCIYMYAFTCMHLHVSWLLVCICTLLFTFTHFVCIYMLLFELYAFARCRHSFPGVCLLVCAYSLCMHLARACARALSLSGFLALWLSLARACALSMCSYRLTAVYGTAVVGERAGRLQRVHAGLKVRGIDFGVDAFGR